MVRMPAFGLTGPWRDRVGFAPTMEQIAGLAWVTGLPDGLPVAPRGACDPLAGAHAAFATARGAGVRGAHGARSARRGADDRDRAQRDRRSDNGIRGVRGGHGAARQPRPHRQRIRTSTDAQARTTGSRSACAPTINARALAELIGDGRRHRRSGSSTRTPTAVVERLAEAGIPAAVVVSPSLVTENPQLVHRGFFERLDASAHRARACTRVRRSPASTREPMAAPPAADARAAQRRGVDRTVRADRGRSRATCRRRRHRHQAERAVTGVSAAAARSPSRRRSTCCWSGWDRRPSACRA